LGSKGWGVKFKVYNDLLHHSPSCCGQGRFYTFFSFTFVYLLFTLFSFQQSDDVRTKITEDVTADEARISNDSGIIVNYYNSVKDE
jgi:hypothetical protein